MTRREFVGSTGWLSAELAAAPAPPWADRPMRWAQLAFVESDPGNYDPKFWLDYFKRTYCDAACLSAGGCVAFYPTKIPFHYRSAWLKDGDAFGEMAAGCRKLGMVVVARTDPHSIRDAAAAAHPEWIAVDAQGNPRKHWAAPGRWVTCALGPYNFEFMTEVNREIMRLYKVDAIFSNRWAGHGICYCESCRKLFQTFCGMDLPRGARDPRDPARRNYIVWRERRLFELWRLWDREIRKLNPNAFFMANAGGGALSELDMKTIGDLAPTLAADRQARRGLTSPWAAGKNGKEYRATLGRGPVAGLFSVGLEEPYRWKDSVQNDAEIRIWVADATANGMRPWFTKFSAVLYDPRWLKTVEEIFVWHKRSERYLRDQQPMARVAVVYSQQTAAFYGGDQARAKVEDHTLGMYQALVESRIPFEMTHDRLLDAAHIDRFKLLILPNIAALSDAQCRQLREYVARGGSLLATHETSLYNEWGEPRGDFGLSDLFGVRYKGKVEGPMQNSYLRLEHETRHPLLAGLEDAPRIVNGARRVDVEAVAKFPPPPLTLIPSYPDLPMEEVYPRQPRTDTPEVYLREIGPGRVVYFPWDIDRTFWEVLCVDHLKLLRNAVDWATNEPRSVTVAGPGILDVTVWRQKDSITVHLVNLNNPMMMKGPYRELIPSPPQKVTVRLPQGVKARGAHLLKAGQTPKVEQATGSITVLVPMILDHEVIAIDLA